MSFELDFKNDENLIFYLSGDIDINNVEDFKEKVFNIYDVNKNNIVLDLKDLNYIDSTGLGAIMSIYKKAKDDSNELTILNPKKNIKKLFMITELDTVFNMEG